MRTSLFAVAIDPVQYFILISYILFLHAGHANFDFN